MEPGHSLAWPDVPGKGTSGHYCQHSVIQWNFIRVTSRRSRETAQSRNALTTITRDCGVSLPRSMSNTRESTASHSDPFPFPGTSGRARLAGAAVVANCRKHKFVLLLCIPGPLAQQAERRADNAKVVSSRLTWTTFFHLVLFVPINFFFLLYTFSIVQVNRDEELDKVLYITFFFPRI